MTCNLSKNGCVWTAQWPTSSELKIKFDPSLDRSWCESFKIIKDRGPKNPPPGCNLGGLFPFSKKNQPSVLSIYIVVLALVVGVMVRSFMKGIWLNCMVLPEGIFSSNWAAEEPVVELAKLTLTQRYVLTRSCQVTILVTTVYKSGINPHGYLNNVNVHDIGCGVYQFRVYQISMILCHNWYSPTEVMLKVAFFQKVRCVFQISKKYILKNYPGLEI